MADFDVKESGGNWEGVLSDSSTHATVGRRAWCFTCSEWCYISAVCVCCDAQELPEKWAGMYAAEMLKVITKEVEQMRPAGYVTDDPEKDLLRRVDVLKMLRGEK